MKLKQAEELTEDIVKLKIEEIVRRDITSFGSGSHVILPKKHAGKKAIVIIKNG